MKIQKLKFRLTLGKVYLLDIFGCWSQDKQRREKVAVKN